MTSPNGAGHNGSAHRDRPSRPAQPDEPRTGGWGLRLLALIGVTTTVALFAFLIVFAFTGSDTRNPDELDQAGFSAAALVICEGHQLDILALTPAQDVDSPAERADVLDDADIILADMITQLRVEVAGRDVVDDLPDARSSDLSADEQLVLDAGTLSTKDADNLGRWLDDYDVYLGDRQTHSTRLREEGDVRFLVTDKDGGPISVSIDGYARVNDMVPDDENNPGCAVPLDL
ncbi:MAG: hypothetical protein ACR2QE_04650 [Acidimicrobiales bacterium]